MRQRIHTRLERALEGLTIGLMVALALVVILGVAFRKAGSALVWYDEVASILLAWLTFYGAALAALKRAHIGFPKIVESLPDVARKVAVVVSEVFVIGFFLVVTWAGWQVFLVLEGDMLVSLPWLPQRVVQSAVPVGAILFIVAELLTLPEVLRGTPPPIDGPGSDPGSSSPPGLPSGPTPDPDSQPGAPA